MIHVHRERKRGREMEMERKSKSRRKEVREIRNDGVKEKQFMMTESKQAGVIRFGG